MSAPREGDRAPDFTLTGTTGEVTLSRELASGPVVLIFYQEDNTPTCSQQVTTFRDEFETLAELGARVLAVSTDTLETHRTFDERLGGLPFPLLADPDLTVTRLYAVEDPTVKRAYRAAFAIAPDGVIRRAFVPYSVAGTQHFLEIFEALGLE